MKLAPDSLLEIVAIIQKGLLMQTDISDELRNLDLQENEDGKLSLSDEYQASRQKD